MTEPPDLVGAVLQANDCMAGRGHVAQGVTGHEDLAGHAIGRHAGLGGPTRGPAVLAADAASGILFLLLAKLTLIPGGQLDPELGAPEAVLLGLRQTLGDVDHTFHDSCRVVITGDRQKFMGMGCMCFVHP